MTVPFARAARREPASSVVALDRARQSSPAGLNVLTHEEGGCVVLRLVGAVDAFSVPVFRSAAAELVPGASLVVDVSAVSFIDSAGLGALIGAVRRVRDLGGEVAVSAPRPLIARVLRTTGVDRIVQVFDSVEGAVAAAQGGLAAAAAVVGAV